MSKPSLDGVDQRIARADEYLDLLKGEVAPISGPDSYQLLGHFDRDTSEYVFRVEADNFPDGLGIRVGEIAHHLRSALDNLAWQLVRARGGTPREDRDVNFPIRKNKPASDSWQEKPLPGLTSEDRASVEAAQPYHFGPHWYRRHLLWLLAHLNNVDKHRRLHVGFLAIGFTVSLPDPIAIPLHHGMEDLVRFLPPDGTKGAFTLGIGSLVPNDDCGPIDGLRFSSTRALDDPAEVMRVGLPEAGANPEMKMEPEPTFEVSVTDAENPVTLADLGRIRDRVEELVDRFRPAFK